MRLTKKERAAIGAVAGMGIDSMYSTILYDLNFEGGYNFEEPYTTEEVGRIINWIWKKLGLGA